jgi:hypothetical protein
MAVHTSTRKQFFVSPLVDKCAVAVPFSHADTNADAEALRESDPSTKSPANLPAEPAANAPAEQATHHGAYPPPDD